MRNKQATKTKPQKKAPAVNSRTVFEKLTNDTCDYPKRNSAGSISGDHETYNTTSYEQLAAKLLGTPVSWKPKITDSEHILLERIRHINSIEPRKVQTTRRTMPPGTIPNPTKKKIRPSSASANIQSHPSYKSGLYDNTRPTTASQTASGGLLSQLGRPKTQASGPRFWSKGKTEETTDTSSARPQRRLTVGAVDGIDKLHGVTVWKAGRAATTLSMGQMMKGKIEDKISLDTLDALKRKFQSVDENGTGQLELEEFKKLLKNCLNIPVTKEAQIDALFQKIDWSSEGAITWDEFCTYMQLEYAEKEDSYQRAKEVAFHLPAKIKNIPHRNKHHGEPILRLTDTSDGHFMACSQDGLVSFWSSNMELKRTKTVQAAEQPGVKDKKTKWITDFCIMHQYNKFVVGTGEREIQFFELSSFEPYCQINSLETVPLKLDYSSTGDDEFIILYGDSEGCINIIHVTSAGECLRTWKNNSIKSEGMPSVGIDDIAKGDRRTKFLRWKAHDDWVQQLQYNHELRQVISCSNNADTALVIGSTMGSTDAGQQLKQLNTEANQSFDRQKNKAGPGWMQAKKRLEADEVVFKVYKGVKCFHFSKSQNALVTGGMDRIVRIWNPYVAGKPTGMLRGHNAPIFYLFIAEEDNRVFSISTDKCIKIWDIQDQNCLITVRPKGHKIRGDLQACHFSNISKTLAIATDQMNGLPLRLKPMLKADIPITHKEPIHAVAYNTHFKQVITCSDGSVIKVWDLETGSAIFEYGEAHGDQAITALTFDTTGRRLISGGRDGCVRIWNYNNGHNLRTMMKEKKNEEISSLAYVEMSKNRFIISVGWDRRINIYNDTSDSGVHHVQHPQPNWSDDLRNGHKEDILSVAIAPPNLLATSSYDGEVIVWNLISGHIFCHLHSPHAKTATLDETLDGELSVNKVLFITSRTTNKDVAQLISSGPKGHIHFWNVFNGGKLKACFAGSKIEGALVTAMAITSNNMTLISADNYGFVYLWSLDEYALDLDEAEPPELIVTWRGHVENVTSITIVEEYNIIITSSLDCTVRLWTFDSEYVGTLGQPDTWDIFNFSTYQHPMVPYDVLVDPLSLPDHPAIYGRHNVHKIVHEDSARQSDEEDSPKDPTPQLIAYSKQQYYVDDDTIAKQLAQKPFSKGTGKRLRHEKLKPIKEDRGGPSEYRMLRCFDLEEAPQPTPPEIKNKKDQFDFFD